MRTRQVSSLFICILLLAACGKKEEKTREPIDYSKTYFSIRLFTADQFKNHLGSPFVVTKLTNTNGSHDSTTMNSYNTDWGEIMKTFFETDIGLPELVGKYEYSSFDDETTGAKIHYYEAIDKSLFAKTYQIRVDPFTDHILSIYIEASKNSFWSEFSEKLYYVPMKEIQIQQFEKPLIGSTKNTKVEYKFNL